MSKEEFKEMVNRPVPDNFYEVIQTVYMYHPCISNTDGKREIAKLYEKFGSRLILDMYKTATAVKEYDDKIQSLYAQIEQTKILKEQYIATL